LVGEEAAGVRKPALVGAAGGLVADDGGEAVGEGQMLGVNGQLRVRLATRALRRMQNAVATPAYRAMVNPDANRSSDTTVSSDLRASIPMNTIFKKE
jgi:hypothetical protein